MNRRKKCVIDFTVFNEVVKENRDSDRKYEVKDRERRGPKEKDNSGQMKAGEPAPLPGPLEQEGDAGLEQMDSNCTQSVFRAQSLCPTGAIGETLLSN